MTIKNAPLSVVVSDERVFFVVTNQKATSRVSVAGLFLSREALRLVFCLIDCLLFFLALIEESLNDALVAQLDRIINGFC